MSIRLFVSFTCLIGCQEVQHTNPYDPKSPLSIQAVGVIKGQLYSAIPGDLEDKEYQLKLQ